MLQTLHLLFYWLPCCFIYIFGQNLGMGRESTIIKTSVVGIIVNLILVVFKASVGIFVNSIAITLDAINNLTDALSSIITIIGTKLANKAPDKNHPYGYGRIEYFSSVIIAVIVLWAGITAFQESWPKIFNPDVTSYTTVSLIIIAVAVVVKILLGRYVKNIGEKINSRALVASGSDAFFDAILSLSTLIAAIISIYFNISIEGILGVIISFVIIKASIDILKETIDSMIGNRVDSELSLKIKNLIEEFDEVYGAYDLTLHNYGPENMMGSVHIEINDELSASEIHTLTRNITTKIYDELSIILTVGIYARNNKFDFIKNDLDKIVSEYEEVLQIHGFYVYENEKLVSFDIIVDFDADRDAVKNEISSKIKEKHPEFDYIIIDDYDVSD